jgi:hypothetical protein
MSLKKGKRIENKGERNCIIRRGAQGAEPTALGSLFIEGFYKKIK